MKAESVVPVTVAVLAAAASVFGVLYNQRGSLNLERQKWQQTVELQRMNLEREAISEFAKSLSDSFYLLQDMMWRVEMMADSLTQNDFLTYAKASDAIKPKLTTTEVKLAATSSIRHSKVKSALAEYRRIDEQLIVSGRRIDTHRVETLHLLNEEVKNLPAFRELVLGSLSDAASVGNTRTEMGQPK